LIKEIGNPEQHQSARQKEEDAEDQDQWRLVFAALRWWEVEETRHGG
jgi:hypothetical protein